VKHDEETLKLSNQKEISGPSLFSAITDLLWLEMVLASMLIRSRKNILRAEKFRSRLCSPLRFKSCKSFIAQRFRAIFY
jgi:hypothetical protein